ncbi:MDR family MFS transporter [Engelhardtia mirabilis]|uniref:Multidrug resistance protein MdtH n=1 Tax=Engelhardtia mirabilis TaxID=2528011 RepID=A0A518BDL1_9BACT|nr:multidrug resistance protein MdtH [Planctomycetes bacterium Pla133]QDU99391.1 multidrug resistance protein MdtH [Planctomycetes bacterium Pla86]
MFARLWQGHARSLTGLPREIWILSAVLLVNRAGVMVMPFLGIYLVMKRDFSPLEMGAFMALAGVGSMVGVQLGGWLTDRIGHLKVQLGSMILAAPLFLLLGAQEHPAAIAVALFALTVAFDGIRPANGAAIALYSPLEVRTRAFGLMRLAVNLGVTVGPALGGVLAGIDYAWLFRANALASLVSAGVLYALGRGWTPVAELEEPARADSRAYTPWRDRRLLIFMGLLVIGSIPFFQIQSTLPLFLKEVRGMSEAWIGATFAINTVVIVLCELPLLYAIRRHSSIRVTAWGCLFAGLGFGLTPLWPGFAWVAVTVLVWTVGEMLQAPSAVAWVSLRGPNATRGRTMGVFGLGFALAAMLGPLFGTFLYEYIGPRAPWAGCALLGVLTYLGMTALARAEARDDEPQPQTPPADTTAA